MTSVFVGVVMGKMLKFPIFRIHSIAIRNFRSLTGLHTFNFESGINVITGGNSSGKSTVMDAVEIALSPATDHGMFSYWQSKSDVASLIEITFTAKEQFHYLRRVIQDDRTTDIHLYVGNERRNFYRDGEASEYLAELGISYYTELTRKYGIRISWTNFPKVYSNSDVISYKFEDAKLNEEVSKVLKECYTDISSIFSVDDAPYVKFEDGSKIRLEQLSTSEIDFIKSIGTLVSYINDVKSENKPTVLIFDDYERDFPPKLRNVFVKVLDSITRDYNWQILITSRFRMENTNHIKLRQNRMPRMYNLLSSNPPYMSQALKSFNSKFKRNFKPGGGKR